MGGQIRGDHALAGWHGAAPALEVGQVRQIGTAGVVGDTVSNQIGDRVARKCN